MQRATQFATPASALDLPARLRRVRAQTQALAAPLSDADATAQSMPDASPAKWHLAHTTWFFERFVLQQLAAPPAVFHDRYDFLFNSYYDGVGPRLARPQRGLLTRPSLEEIYAYRAFVDELLAVHWPEIIETQVDRIELGIAHEEQHQELLLTDILHLFAHNPLRPAYRPPSRRPHGLDEAEPLAMIAFQGGLTEIGAPDPGFAFDIERPRHQAYVAPFRLAQRCVTNGEWLDFIAAGGYNTPSLWMADGFALAQREGWQAPLYWRQTEQGWETMTLAGPAALDPAAPVVHISWYEADAFARFAGKRLPTEQEWEFAAKDQFIAGNFADGPLSPMPASASGLAQMFGDVWEWTMSAFSPYPGFAPAAGAIGEYNGKFMVGQFVLRGGACVSPPDHLRASYRNFFYPHQRWQFAGLRLAESA